MDDFNLRCINCGGFHEYGKWHCYDQRWENQPRASWESEEDFHPWNPPYYQHYGGYEHQPFKQEEPHQGYGVGRERLEELLEGFITRIDNNYKNFRIDFDFKINCVEKVKNMHYFFYKRKTLNTQYYSYFYLYCKMYIYHLRAMFTVKNERI